MRALTALAIALVVSAGVAAGELRLNDIQVIGSHNSYKEALPGWSAVLLRLFQRELYLNLDYAHPPLTSQLDAGLRKLELDVFYDPTGSLFNRGDSSQFPVLHVQTIDPRSNCANLAVCLGEVVDWSRAQPDHLPIVISLNAKDRTIDWPLVLQPEPFDASAFDALDQEIRTLLGERLLAPVEVLQSGAAPRWPELAASRGRVLMVLDEQGDKRDIYARDYATRAMFGNHSAEHPGAAIMIINDPIGDSQRITEMVRAGYLVRTRADADTREARDGDVRRREAALASGAHLISTDYYPGVDAPFDYTVELPGGAVARCNPVRVSDPDRCAQLQSR